MVILCVIYCGKSGENQRFKHITKCKHVDFGSPSVGFFFVAGDTGRCDSEMTSFSDLLSLSFASRYC